MNYSILLSFGKFVKKRRLYIFCFGMLIILSIYISDLIVLKYKYTGDYKVLDSIDKIYVLNLDRHTGRYANTEKAIDGLKLGAGIERFSAIDGRKIRLINESTGKVITADMLLPNSGLLSGRFKIEYPNSKLNDLYVDIKLREFTKRAAGEFGCYCSHREIWNDILEKGYKKVLVVEDDVNFVKFSREILALSMENIPKDYDLLYLVVSGRFYSLDYSTMLMFYTKIFGNITSTEAYILTANGARILLENTKNSDLHIDHKMSKIIQDGKINAYAVHPFIILQGAESIISSNE